MKCKYNDCGWCYCKSGKSNDENGQCNKPEDCEENKEGGHLTVNIPETFYWSTYHVHHNNEQTLGEFLYTILPEEYTVTFVDGTYAEITKEGTTETYSVHASGNGDFYNHKIEFEEI